MGDRAIGARRRSLALVGSILLFLCSGMAAGGPMDGFIDPSDGEFDVSDFLLNKRGFLLNPLVITEPAIGYGGGGTLLFFHEQAGEEDREEGEVLGLPPSISFAVGGGTETSSWLGAGGHFGSFREDSIRYIGSAGYASLNIDFYIGDEDLGYGLDGIFVYNQLDFRLGKSDFFIGGRHIYTRLESEFDIPPALSDFLPSELTFDASGIGPVFRYDSRDNIFTANSGMEIEVVPLFYTEELGSDKAYQILNTQTRVYAPVHEKVVLAARLDSQFSFGDTPFFALPSIQARGVPVTRYQNEYSVSSEVQARWNLWRRWSLIGFFGLGWVGGDIDILEDSQVVPSGGGGFRYLIARVLNVQMGMDFAGSEDEFAFYFQIGTGW